MYKNLQKLLIKEMCLLSFLCIGITYESLHRFGTEDVAREQNKFFLFFKQILLAKKFVFYVFHTNLHRYSVLELH